MNAVKMEELFDQSRRMIDGRAQLDEVRRAREHRVLNDAPQLSEQVRGLISDDVSPVDTVVVCHSHKNAQRQTPLVILEQVHITGADAEHLGHLGLGLAALAAELPKLRSHEGLGHSRSLTKLHTLHVCLETYNTSTRKEKDLVACNGTSKL